ncbi:ubiquinone biosynthesis protein COQ4 mitochondrial [Dichomitus squalens]|uniref:4-hydroxy-3-methoxy-5-polyprenylbenzoate decarboxylase n=1 Tax=Dichomitus squalens TaxID=114155 RepID=A0A4Q9NRE0_9APHY|nr:ubiquinone biosynthesis protein COQ4 mitochondrial [Dichomitus squalens]TBU62744.1 ubiquinone biosynthesis protein COQ4 mitochondrial [Dichomitus squalens]
MSLVSASLHASRRSAWFLAALAPANVALRHPARWQTRSVKTQPAYEGHIPLNWFEAGFLTLGSAFMSLANPRRGDMVAALGDLTSGPVLPRLRDSMLESAEGRQILKDRPRINSDTVDMNKLALLPEGTFGNAYVTWLERCGVTPDTREPVHYVDDPELAYVMQRYRECHDFYHCILNMPVNVEAELAVKFFEFANLGIPMTGLAAAFGHLRLTHAKRQRLFRDFVPWAVKCGSSAQSLITVYWEKRWEQNVEEMKQELGVWDSPVEPRWGKPLSEARAAAQKRGETQLQQQAS